MITIEEIDNSHSQYVDTIVNSFFDFENADIFILLVILKVLYENVIGSSNGVNTPVK